MVEPRGSVTFVVKCMQCSAHKEVELAREAITPCDCGSVAWEIVKSTTQPPLIK